MCAFRKCCTSSLSLPQSEASLPYQPQLVLPLTTMPQWKHPPFHNLGSDLKLFPCHLAWEIVKKILTSYSPSRTSGTWRVISLQGLVLL